MQTENSEVLTLNMKLENNKMVLKIKSQRWNKNIWKMNKFGKKYFQGSLVIYFLYLDIKFHISSDSSLTKFSTKFSVSAVKCIEVTERQFCYATYTLLQ